MNAKYGLESIRDKRLKISRLLELNDPFEFLAVQMTNRDLRKDFLVAREDVGEQYGLVCFSKDWKSPLQWAHYADKHQGVCLGFEVPRKMLEKVDYVEKRIPFPTSMDEAFVMRLLKTKYKHWIYEKEYRAFLPLEEAEGRFYFTDFNDNLVLEQVIVGINSKIPRSRIADVLGARASNVETFKARPGFSKFEIVKQNRESLWK